jgi:DNA-binding PadR family transcriptional regulator
MEAEGLLSSRAQVVESKSLRSYAITAAGRRALEEMIAQLRELADEVLGDGGP